VRNRSGAAPAATGLHPHALEPLLTSGPRAPGSER
jgi:hypothetical protein